jgi:hypothetical protein
MQPAARELKPRGYLPKYNFYLTNEQLNKTHMKNKIQFETELGNRNYIIFKNLKISNISKYF